MPAESPRFTLESIRLNPSLNRSALADGFREHRRLQVPDLFTPATADRLYRCLHEETPWGMAYHDGKEARFESANQWDAHGPQAKRLILQGIEQRAGHMFQYLYRCYPMLTAYTSGWNPGLVLHHFLEFLNTGEMLDLVREITGIPGLVKADAQATWYEPGHFLTLHNDADTSEGRRIAYVIGMARDWREADGGYLLFLDDHGDITSGFRPRFNCLNLFAVPQLHLVSCVASFARGKRYAITGWFRDR